MKEEKIGLSEFNYLTDKLDYIKCYPISKETRTQHKLKVLKDIIENTSWEKIK